MKKDDEAEFESETYDKYFMRFPTDYDRENPVTKNEAFFRFLENRIKNAKNKDELYRLNMQKNQIANASVFDAVRNYSNKRETQIQKESMIQGIQGKLL